MNHYVVFLSSSIHHPVQEFLSDVYFNHQTAMWSIGQPLVLMHIMPLSELSATIFKCIILPSRPLDVSSSYITQ
jgi:hypothetical protein